MLSSKRVVMLALFVPAFALFGLFASNSASAQARLAAGTLTCRGNGTVGLILGSSQKLRCEFQRVNNGPRSNYSGRITKVGLSLGVTGRNVLVWTVLASTDQLPGSALSGKYAGVGANASLGVGVGANALIGGSSNSVVLQPLSVQAQTGVNIAAGVSGLRLTLID
jgi:Protein of unknown function (DUF992)